MSKQINLRIRFRQPEDRKAAKVTFYRDGKIVFTDDKGNPVTPEHMERTIEYPRVKGPKIQSRSKVTGDWVSVGGIKEFTGYQSVFVIDTNTIIVNGEKTSVSCFICCRFLPEGDRVRVDCNERLNIYEFHDVPEKENPEMLAILRLARDVVRSSSPYNKVKFAIVLDSELDCHDAISSGQQPIYGACCLPPGFVLHYASADTGREAINRLIKFCDKQASIYLRFLERGRVKTSELVPLEEEPSVKYRHMFRDGVEIINPTIGPNISIQTGTKIRMYGIK